MSGAPKLNLIPEAHKAALRHEHFRQTARTTAYIAVLILCAVATLLLAVQYTMETQFIQIVDDTTRVTGTNQSMETQVSTLNLALANAVKIIADVHPWGTFLRALPPLIPSGVQITSLNLNATDASTIDGVASTRDALIAFKKNLAAAPFITNIDLPLNDLLSPSVIHFSVHFNIDFTKLH